VAAIQRAGPYTDEIIPPELWPTAHEAAASAATSFRDACQESESAADAYRRAARRLAEISEGGTSDALITVHRELAVDHDNHAAIREAVVKAARQAADRGRELIDRLKAIDFEAHQEIAASPPAAREAIIDEARARAVATHAEFAIAVAGHHGKATEAVTPLVAGIVGRAVPAAPPPAAPAPTDSEAADPGPGGAGQRAPKTSREAGDGTAVEPSGEEQRRKKTIVDDASAPTPQPDGEDQRAAMDAFGSLPAGLAPAGSGGLGGSGLSSAGGLGLSPMSSGGAGLGGLGPASGVAAMPAGAGAQSAGLSGLAGGGSSTAAQTGQIGSAATGFTQGVSAGSNAGSALSLPPATGIGTPAPGTASAPPVAALSGPGAAAPAGSAPGAAAAASASGAGSSGMAGAAPASMMVPAPGMGAPVAAGPGAPVMSPAGSAIPSSGSMGSVGAAPSGAGSAGAVLVPASTVASCGARSRGPTESAELAAAKALALKLRRDCDGAKYPCIEWAVGIFRSEAGGATECLVTSNEGFGYIPWGVFLPRSARVLASDKLVDNEFRDHWFGCKDPAQVMVEYSKVRARQGSRLVALGVTNNSVYGRGSGVEYGVSAPRSMNEEYREPVLDDLHQHRLEALQPEIYLRVARLASTETETREIDSQITVSMAAKMMDAVTTAARTGVEVPPLLRELWNRTGVEDCSKDKVWDDYGLQMLVCFVNTSAGRPDPATADTGARELYRGQWQVARAIEMVWGLSGPARDKQHVTGGAVWADMLYAAAVFADQDDFVRIVEPLVRVVEDGRGR
jgi:hypothetical protein